MIAIYSNRINCDSGMFQDNNLPTDLRIQLVAVRPLLLNVFQISDYYQFLIESESITLIRKGTATTKLIDLIPQQTVQLLNSITEKVANL